MKINILLIAITLFTSCSTTILNKNPLNKVFPNAQGNSLDHKKWNIPKDMEGQQAILLVGYVRGSQFDIDRWLIGLNQTGVKTPVYEIPTIDSFWAKLFSKKLDNSMRSGIPIKLWSNVITVYDESKQIINFLGNEKPKNARVILLNQSGKVIYFHDKGFSAPDLESLLKLIPSENKNSCI